MPEKNDVVSEAVARKTKKPKKGELYRVHVIMPAEMVEMIDRFSAAQSDGSDFRMALSRSRSDAIRTLVLTGLIKHGLVKPKS